MPAQQRPFRQLGAWSPPGSFPRRALPSSLSASRASGRARLPKASLRRVGGHWSATGRQRRVKSRQRAGYELFVERVDVPRPMSPFFDHANPDILVDELTTREMIASSGLSPDGALLHLSPEGLTLKSLTSAGARDTLERIARLFRSAWAGTPGPHLSYPRPSAELLSNLWVVTHNQWSTAARVKAVKDAGVLDDFVVMKTADLLFRTNTAEPTENAPWEIVVSDGGRCQFTGVSVSGVSGVSDGGNPGTHQLRIQPKESKCSPTAHNRR
jgi:hypothetical protein